MGPVMNDLVVITPRLLASVVRLRVRWVGLCFNLAGVSRKSRGRSEGICEFASDRAGGF